MVFDGALERGSGRRRRVAHEDGLLQPALLAGQAGGFDAVAGAEFADRLGQVVAYGARGQVEQRCDVACGQTIASEAQHLPLAIIERIGFGPRVGRELRIDRAAS